MTSNSAPPSVRVFGCGATGTGKTTALRKLYVERAPRVLVLDFLGTDWPSLEGAQVAEGLGELHRRLRQAAGAGRWRIVALVDPEEALELAPFLVPENLGAGAPSYVRGVGGFSLVLDECDILAPAASAAPAVLNWARRGRHVGLSLLAATQRPAQVHRLFTAQAEYLLLCAQHEPRDLEYLGRIVPPVVLAELEALPPFGCVAWATRERRGWILDRERRVTGTIE